MLTPGTIIDLTGFFRADQVCTPVASAVTVDLTEPPAAAHKRLKSANFDQAPVMREGRPVGWVTTEALARLEVVRFSMTRLEDCVLISAESSITRVLPLLTEHKFLYVVGAGEVLGFIVPSDLDRQPVRSYVYLLIAGIEMQLAEIVGKSREPHEIAKEIGGRLASVYQDAREMAQEANPVEYLNLKGLIKLFKGAMYNNRALCDERLYGLLGDIAKFRNDVMHANRSLAASADAASIGDLPSWATEVSGALSDVIASLTPST